MISFDDILKQVHQIEDIILSDTLTDTDNQEVETVIFSKHIITTKRWFVRISCINKKAFLISLLEDLKSIWALSVILKSIWNCRTKDSVMTVSEFKTMIGYDRPPMDHNRTAKPAATLQEVMLEERRYFNSLKPVVFIHLTSFLRLSILSISCIIIEKMFPELTEHSPFTTFIKDRQALFLLDLLSISGGPILCEVLKYCNKMYEEYVNHKMSSLRDTVVITEPLPAKMVPETLETNLAALSMKIKAMRDSTKLEEVEQIFDDGTKRRMWRVSRPKPEAPETSDVIQLLPSAISKIIFMYLPLSQLSDCAKVNKYWAYIVDEIRLELVARQKINIELEKMRVGDNIIRHDEDLDLFNQLESPSTRTCIKKTRNFISKRDKYKGIKRKKIKNPFPNMNSINEQLNRRGAADEHVWKWCSNVMKFYTEINAEKSYQHEGLMKVGDTHFPCPTLGRGIAIPLDPPLTRDPVKW